MKVPKLGPLPNSFQDRTQIEQPPLTMKSNSQPSSSTQVLPNSDSQKQLYPPFIPTQQHSQQNFEQTENNHTSPSMLYKKCFPNASISFKERFPVFADIIGKYNKNIKAAPLALTQK